MIRVNNNWEAQQHCAVLLQQLNDRQSIALEQPSHSYLARSPVLKAFHSKVAMTCTDPPWEEALHAVLNGMTLRQAAMRFRVGKEALRERLNGTRAVNVRRGRPSYLTPENEKEVLKVVATRSQMGVRLDKSELRDIIRQCALAHKPAGIPDTFPNDKWIQRFIHRHKSHFSYRKTQVPDGERTDCSTEKVARGDTSRSDPDDTGVRVQDTATNPVANIRRSLDGENVSIALEPMPSTAAAALPEFAQERELIAQRCVELMDRKLKRELAAQKRHTDEQVNRLEKMHREQQKIQQEQHSQLLAAMQQQQMMMSNLITSLAPAAN